MEFPAIAQFLADLCKRGPWTIGQVRVAPDLVLHHVDDAASARLEIFTRPSDAREIAKHDDAGNYRPLKTAPNLRHGWELRLDSIADLRLALDFIYPAAVGTWLAFQKGAAAPVNLRETLDRQSGMYRVTRHLRDDQAGDLVGKICIAGCLRHRLWSITPGHEPPITIHDSPFTNHTVPILCLEACNLLVAAARPLAKQNLPPPGRGKTQQGEGSLPPSNES